MSNALPGWFPPDPSKPKELRYWNGNAWTEHFHTQAPIAPPAKSATAAKAPGLVAANPWLTSWPAITVGLFLFVIPGLVLLWHKKDEQAWVKLVATVAVVPAMFMAVGFGAAAAPADTSSADRQAQTQTQTVAESETPSFPDSEAGPVGASAHPSAHPSALGTPGPTASPFVYGDSPGSGSTIQAGASATNGTAMAAALKLTVKGRAPKTGYTRAQFGSGWVDIDRNGCDTRNDELRLRLTNKTMSNWCKVLSGDLQDPYTGTSVHFEYGGASEVDIDHMVALSDAWQKGAATWEFAKRVAFANDPLNVEPVDASANRQKSDGDTATWLPSNKSYRCTYVARQVAVKTKYGVWVTQAELDAMVRVLDACPNQALPDFGSQPIIASNTGGPAPTPAPVVVAAPAPPPVVVAAPAPAPVVVAAPAPAPVVAIPTDPRFPYCKDAIPAGYGNYVKGVDPEYEWYRDADHDGIVCEF